MQNSSDSVLDDEAKSTASGNSLLLAYRTCGQKEWILGVRFLG
jgi:hypothetical protein